MDEPPFATQRPEDPEVSFRSEKPGDIEQIHDLHISAFETGGEARLVRDLRHEKAFLPGMSLVAVADKNIIGHVLFSPLRIITKDLEIKAAALAPVAVLPAFQGRGIGTSLILYGLKTLGSLGVPCVLVLGSPAYYQRFGFDHSLVKHIDSPYQSEAFMGLELQNDVLKTLRGAKAVYARAFEALND